MQNGNEFVSVDQSKIPKILLSRETQETYIALLKKGIDRLSDEEKAYLRGIDDGIKHNFMANYGYTAQEAEDYILELHKKHSS